MTGDGDDDRFDRLDDLTRELAEESDIHLVGVEANEEDTLVTADVAGVRVDAWHDEEYGLLVSSLDEGFEDPDDVIDHVNNVGDEDDLDALLDEAEDLRFRHGDDAVAEYHDRLRGNTD